MAEQTIAKTEKRSLDFSDFFTDFWYQDANKLRRALEYLKSELKTRGGKISLIDNRLPPNLLLAVQVAAGTLKSEEYSINTLEPMEAILAREGVDQDAHILTDAALKVLDNNVDLMYSGWRKPVNEFGDWLERTGWGEDFYHATSYTSMAIAAAASAAARANGKGSYEPGPENDAVVSQEDSAAAKEAGAIGSGEIGSVEGAGENSGDLNWDKVVSKKGETRIDHVNRHSVPNPQRANHGVFNGKPQDIVNKAWKNKGNIVLFDDGMGGKIYNIPYKNAGYESGSINTGAKMDYVIIIVMDGTDDVIAAFPSFGNYVK